MKQTTINVVSPKSVGAAYALWFFLGGFGVHRFYLNRPGSAIAQLVMTITLVLSPVTLVWLIVDIFLIPGMVGNSTAPAFVSVTTTEEK